MPRATVGDLLESVGDPVLRVVHAADLAAPVRDVVIRDPGDEEIAAAGAVLLAVGATPDSGDALAVVDRAGRAGASAVVLRGEPTPPRLVELAARVRLNLLAVPSEMQWGQLYSLLRAAATSAEAQGGGDAAGVPVGDLFALADAIAAAVQAPVTIEDAQWRVLAYSNLGQPLDEPRRQTILGRSPPPEWRQRLEASGVMQALRRGEDLVRFEHEEIEPRSAVPVRAGAEMLGSVWAAGELSAPAQEELLRAGRIAAVHMIAHRAGEDLARRARGAAVREVLEGRAGRDRLAPFATVGPWTVIAFEPAAGEGWRGDPDRVLSILALFAEEIHRDARCAQFAGRLWALIPVPARDGETRLETVATRVIERAAEVLGEQLRAGIGCHVARLTAAPRSRETAEQALGVLARRGGTPRVAQFEAVRPYALLSELLELAATHPALQEGPVAELTDEQARTLRAWLDAHGDVAAAAETLGIHANTLRYRLRRLTDTAGVGVSDADQRLLAEVQLRLRELAQPQSG